MSGIVANYPTRASPLAHRVVHQRLKPVLDALLDIVLGEDVDDAHMVHLGQREVAFVGGLEATTVAVEHALQASGRNEEHSFKPFPVPISVGTDNNEKSLATGVLFGRLVWQLDLGLTQRHGVRVLDRLPDGLALALGNRVRVEDVRRRLGL